MSPAAPADPALLLALPPASPRLQLAVYNGDLRFVRQPLIVGHYRAIVLTGTEAVVDRLIGHTMSTSLRMGRYPEAPGSHQLFGNLLAPSDNPLQAPRPEAVLVVGLGAEGQLQAADLVHTVRLGTLAWAQQLLERPGQAPPQFELAATLIGSGGSGIQPGQSAQLIAQGVAEANAQLSAQGWPPVARLTLVELYLDRASEAWRALQLQAQAAPGRFGLDAELRIGPGALRRPPGLGYRGARHDLIIATQVPTAQGPGIQYTLDTQRARTELRAQATQVPLLRQLVAQGARHEPLDEQLGRTLYRLLVPVEMTPFLSGTTALVLELDRHTAAIPWEMLDNGQDSPGEAATKTSPSGAHKPWALRTSLLRKLRTEHFRERVDDAGTQAAALVIGEPATGAGYGPLPAARREARRVAKKLGGPGGLPAGRVTLLSAADDQQAGPDAASVINTLLSRDWRIVHIAGHGEPPQAPDADAATPPGLAGAATRGVVLSDALYLGALEIQAMPRVPELVFINCCHLGALSMGRWGQLNPAAEAAQPAGFAANLAEALIALGVRCVIAAGWAVHDEPAARFAEVFYEQLLRRRRFIDAVAAAREAAWKLGGHTWAAYQCYGDPDWRLRTDTPDTAAATALPLPQRYDSLCTPVALCLALETLVVERRHQGLAQAEGLARVQYLAQQFDALWGAIGAVAEAYALAFDACGERQQAIAWYRRAVRADDGSASLRAAEHLANLSVRAAWEQVAADLPALGASASAGQHDTLPDTLPQRLTQAFEAVQHGLEVLQRLVDWVPTSERYALLGSAHKRRAQLARAAGDDALVAEALEAMSSAYRRAEDLAREAGSPTLFYPAFNSLAAELVTVALQQHDWPGFAAERLQAITQALARQVAQNPDFFSVAGQAELQLYHALAERRLAGAADAIEAAWDNLNLRQADSSKWASVCDQLDFVLPAHRTRVLSTALSPALAEHARLAELQAIERLLAAARRLAGRASAPPAPPPPSPGP